jgi:hypothetical protein
MTTFDVPNRTLTIGSSAHLQDIEAVARRVEAHPICMEFTYILDHHPMGTHRSFQFMSLW